MKVNKVTVDYSITIQMRQFEPRTVRVVVEAQVDEDDKPEVVYRKVRESARNQAETEYGYLRDKRFESRDDDKELSLNE